MIRKKIFNNTATAFKLKSDLELDRAIFLFSMMNRQKLVQAGSFLTKFSLKFHLPVEGMIKKTIFEQFCGGVHKEDCNEVIQEMHEEKLHSILDYSVEGKETEEQFDAALEKKLSLIKFADKKAELPFTVFKPTGIGRFSIWEKVSEKVNLDEEEKKEWERVKERVEILCKAAYDHNVRLYADGEESWMQDAADELMEEMMRKYNKEKALIFNTIQCYRWDRMDYLKNLHEKGKKDGFKIGAKIVRGAYMEKENARAKKLGYHTPICESKEATDVNFNSVMSYCLNNLDDISVFIGTHNEVSNYLALQIMEDKNIAIDDPRIWFSQLFGMSDHISYNLSRRGYNAAKLVPFGPVRDVVPYLLRRAQENTSVKGQTGRELSLLMEERKRRKGEPNKAHRE
ncbi:proline dehydrogenase family protein [Salegentibacter sp. F188]|uniref:Proline dehydrogenase family protein n=1 Tax=Autumnicola patrickiae TaxID=3075591 RepID=A0ABU3E3L9_9FLAO|nr:proline dehydrogenase family protein [Salegentibacter sp. F188]MDT0690593.1 proline dehydrogenase family protein [Salegentibacter sp. F188]